jgi:hypothetical protein
VRLKAMSPQLAQQPGHHDILVRLREHLTQRRAGQAPFHQQRVAAVDVAGRVQPHGPVPLPRLQPCCLVPLLPSREPNATFSTSAAPERSIAGAVQEHCPPVWNGSPTDSDHWPASSATICGSKTSHSRTGGSRAAVCSKYSGTGKTGMTRTMPGAGGTVNPAHQHRAGGTGRGSCRRLAVNGNDRSRSVRGQSQHAGTGLLTRSVTSMLSLPSRWQRHDLRLLPHVKPADGPADDHALDLRRALENREARGGTSSFRR